MINYKEIEGDLISLALKGEFDVITHGCNCMCTMGAGIAPQMAKAFGVDKFTLEDIQYRGDFNKLGQIEYKEFKLDLKSNELINNWVLHSDINNLPSLYVVNSYTQYNYGRNHSDGDGKPLDYEALTLCMRKINHQFKGKHIGLPKIGCGLAGGDWNRVKNIINEELKGCKVTVVNYVRKN